MDFLLGDFIEWHSLGLLARNEISTINANRFSHEGSALKSVDSSARIRRDFSEKKLIRSITSVIESLCTYENLAFEFHESLRLKNFLVASARTPLAQMPGSTSVDPIEIYHRFSSWRRS